MGRRYCLGVLFPCCALIAVAVIVLAAVIAALFPYLLRGQVDQKVTITPGHATYEQLQNTTLPLWKDIYFFNLTNPEDFQSGKIPELKEIGPYSYRESRTKQFHGFSAGGTLLNYTQTKLFHFDSTHSGEGLKEDDTICTINLPLVTAVAEWSRLTGSEKTAGRGVLLYIFIKTNAKLYVCQNATNLVWNYTDPLIQKLHSNVFLKAFNLNYPQDYVSIQHNNSVNDSRPSFIYTGTEDISRIGQFYQWDGHDARNLSIWPGRTANIINGTEGLFFHPNLQEGETLYAFVDDVVRSFELVNTGQVTHLGVQALRFELTNSTFQNATINSGNARWGSWCPNGLIFLGPIQYPTVPVFGSKPRFLDADPRLRDKVQGLPSPNRTLHDTTIDVEPVTGANVGFKRLLQVNVQVNQTDMFDQLKYVNGTLYYPMFYINEHATLTEDFKQYLESKGLSEVSLFTTLHWVFIALLLVVAVACAVISLVSCVNFIKQHKHPPHREGEAAPLLNHHLQH